MSAFGVLLQDTTTSHTMNETPAPEISKWYPPSETEGESVTVVREAHPPRPQPRPAPELETGRVTVGDEVFEEVAGPHSEEMPQARRFMIFEEIGEVEGQIMNERDDKEDRIVKLELDIAKMRREHQEALEEQTRQTRAAEERLKQTKDLLATKSAELSGARAFLSATDRLSEVEVLSIVRDLNENIYQVAVNLTDEWEKSRSQGTSRMDVDPSSQPWAPSLVKRVVDRDPAGLTFLLQACLCSQVMELTSSWGHHQELSILESIYKRLSASGKHPIAVAK